MLFNSYVFMLFFAAVVVVYYRLPFRLQNIFLLVASYFFYGYWDWRYLLLMVFSTLVTYYAGKKIATSSNEGVRKQMLIISILANLSVLAFFKYFNFFEVQVNSLLELFGLSSQIPIIKVILPVGVSFFTFQALSYTIDVYRGTTTSAISLINYALYHAFFPQLVAGPIERSSSLLPQVENPRRYQTGDFRTGFYLVLMGFFVKMIIADNMAPLVNHVFAQDSSTLSGMDVLTGIYAFSFQIYGDFAGYSLIAKGIAKWLGFDLMWNFNAPYLAVSPRDFWRRWHISLSSWLTDYLYIFGLGGNRGGTWKTYRNLFLTMFLGGLWHGAGWTFILWGSLQGLLLIGYRIAAIKFPGIDKKSLNPIIRIVQGVVFFHIICFTWLLFRADSLPQIVMMVKEIFTDMRVTSFSLYTLGMVLFLVLPFFIYEGLVEKTGDRLSLLKQSWPVQLAVYTYFAGMVLIFPPLTNQVFIYFQF